MRKYYQILGLPDNASLTEIKSSYRKLAFHYHPDRNGSPEAQAKFILIQEAYEVLTGKKKIAQPKIGDYSNRRTRNDDSWEEKVKKARERYEENKMHQERVIANYFKRLRSGWRWLFTKVLVILGSLFAIALLLDLALPHHLTEEKVARYSKEIYSSVSSAQVSLIETERGEKLWVETQNYGLYRHNRTIFIERSWIFYSPLKMLSKQKYIQYSIPIHFTFFWGWMLIVPLFLLPLFCFFYKKNDPFFVITYHATIFIVGPGVIYFLVTEARWLHFVTLGFY